MRRNQLHSTHSLPHTFGFLGFLMASRFSLDSVPVNVGAWYPILDTRKFLFLVHKLYAAIELTNYLCKIIEDIAGFVIC